VDITELSERAERISQRYGEYLGIERDGDWFLLKLQEELGELTQSYLQVTGRARTKGLTDEEIRDGFELEFADVLCQLLLLAATTRSTYQPRSNASGSAARPS
jgi:NTP pyrophosphatase (non-canonical NTP hydrolase)